MSRPEITAVLSLSVQKHINLHNDSRIYWAEEVTYDYASGHVVRVDFMRYLCRMAGITEKNGIILSLSKRQKGKTGKDLFRKFC